MPSHSTIEDQYADLSEFFIRQQRTFVMWVNSKLMEGGESPVGVGPAAPAAFRDGTVVGKLLMCLTSESIRGIDWGPKNPLVISANWSILFKFMASEGIDLGGITTISLAQGNQKTCMALIWRFIQKYELSEPIPGIASSGGIDALLKWVQPRVEPHYPGVKNFTSNWKDGVAFLALYDSIFPGEINFDELDHTAYYDNMQRAFDLFEEKLGVQQILKPEEVTGKSDTKKANICYILQIRNAAIKYEADSQEQEALEKEKQKDEESRHKAENQEHYNNGDKLYAQGLTKMGSTNSTADEKITQIMESEVAERFANIGTLDAEYEEVVAGFQAELDEVLAGFSEAQGKFGEAKEEYNKITPPIEEDVNPAEKLEACDQKHVLCDELREKFKVDLARKLEDAIKNDRGEKKFLDADMLIDDSVFEGGAVVNQVLEEVAQAFKLTNSDAERVPIGKAAEEKIADAADQLFDPIKSMFMEAEQLLDDPQRKADCRSKLDEVDASKAQMLETIRIKIAELKAKSGSDDELSPEQLLQLYHDTTNKIIGLIEDRTVVDEGIPADPAEIRDRLAGIIDEVHNIFGSKDTVRAKIHASCDEVFDQNGIP